MQSSKVYHFLKLLTAKERKQFHDFVRSPYFNKKEDVTQLYELFQAQLLPPKAKNITEEKADELLFPTLPFDKNRFRKLKSELLNLLLSFLKINRYQKDPNTSRLDLLKELNDRQEQDYFLQYWDNASKNEPQHPIPDAEGNRIRMALEYEKMRFQVRKGERFLQAESENMLKALEAAYVEEKLYSLYMLGHNQKLLAGANVLTEWSPFLLDQQENQDTLSDRGTILLHLCLSLILPANPAAFHQLLIALASAKTTLNPNELIDLYTGALNYCIRQINAGQKDCDPELFQLYQQMLSEKSFLRNTM